MPSLINSLIGVPASEAQVRAEVAKFVRTRDVHMMREVMSDNLTHMTSKSGALLQAQGIFIAVATYLLSQGWPRYLALVSILLLTAAALALMTNLRTVFIGRDPNIADDELAEIEIVVQTSLLAARRGVFFNVALYLTFLSILLLGAGAALLEVQH
ncbi:MAG TPA: hypothetical protein VLT91_05380 [Rhizomicrobium sp.]|nr:hypothetical protein [Rhizomicrobium sp.]